MRIFFDFQPTSNRPPQDWREHIPAGFTSRRIDADIATRLQGDYLSAGLAAIFEEAWGGIPQFLTRAFGFVAEWEGDDTPFIACNCRACPVGMNGRGRDDDIAAIQISTRARFQRQGLATLVGAAFIEYCLEQRMTPEYSCEEENTASAALALKLGFVPIIEKQNGGQLCCPPRVLAFG